MAAGGRSPAASGPRQSAVKKSSRRAQLGHQKERLTDSSSMPRRRENTLRRLYGYVACLAVTLGAFLVNAPAASATGLVSNGIAWTDDLNPVPHPPGIIEFCTMGVVGTDSLGNKIGISAAHCVDGTPDGAPVYRYAPTGPREHIGNIAYRSPGGGTGVDWVVLYLNADAVLTSNGPSARVDGIGSPNPIVPTARTGPAPASTAGQSPRRTPHASTATPNQAVATPVDPYFRTTPRSWAWSADSTPRCSRSSTSSSLPSSTASTPNPTPSGKASSSPTTDIDADLPRGQQEVDIQDRQRATRSAAQSATATLGQVGETDCNTATNCPLDILPRGRPGGPSIIRPTSRQRRCRICTHARVRQAGVRAGVQRRRPSAPQVRPARSCLRSNGNRHPRFHVGFRLSCL